METIKAWILSTAHITIETNEYLRNAVGTIRENTPLVFEKGEYGYYIPVPNDGYELAYPDDLQKLIDIAKDFDCGLLWLDRDGEVCNWLPTYDW